MKLYDSYNHKHKEGYEVAFEAANQREVTKWEIADPSQDPSRSVRTLARVNSVHLENGPGPTFWLDWVTNGPSAAREAKQRLLSGHQIAWIDIFEQAIQTVRYRDITERQRPLSYTPHEFALLETRERPLIAPLKGIVATDTNQENNVADVIEAGVGEFTKDLLHTYYLERNGKYRSGYPAQTSETVDLLVAKVV